MNAGLTAIIKRIVAEYGEAVLADPARLKAFFSDLAKDEPKPLRIAFGRCIEAGAYAALKGAPDAAERAERKTMIAQRLRDEHGLDITLCAEALDILEAALFTARKEPPRCAKCGAELREEWKACPYCGTASGGVPWAAPVNQSLPHISPQPIVSPEAQTAILPRKKNKALPVVLAAAAVFVVGSIFLFWFLWSNPASGSEIVSPGSDVYAAGYIWEEEDSKPVYWKNGQIIPLSNEGGMASSIFVSGSDVYAAGWVGKEYRDRKLVYWKNGQIVTLSNKLGEARSIFVSGSDVYAAGEENGKPVYWKNGRIITLSNEGGMAWSIFVSGSDVYAAGREGWKPVYWKNGQTIRLSNKSGDACSIFVSGSDVYAAGDIWEKGDRKPVYWKNGRIITLSNEAGRANSIFVSGSDVYAAGAEDGKLVYWKNGQVITLSNEGGMATSIFVSGSDVYVAGTEDGKPVYWKNGQIITLSNKTGAAHSIFVSGSE